MNAILDIFIAFKYQNGLNLLVGEGSFGNLIKSNFFFCFAVAQTKQRLIYNVINRIVNCILQWILAFLLINHFFSCYNFF